MRLKSFLTNEIKNIRRALPPKRVIILLIGAAILTFGLHNVHRRTGVTEGGVLGMVLLLNNLLGLPAWLTSPILDISCYLLGWRFLGGDFLRISAFSTLSVSAFFRLWQSLPPLMPDLSAHPLIAALAGCVFVGVGVGLVVRQGGSSGGDDALAMVISKKTPLRISHAYCITDFTVLALSLSYIPFGRIAYSLITVTLSSAIIDFIQNVRLPRRHA